MHPTAPISLLSYYKKFASISGALAVATGVGPLLTALLPGAAAGYLFPALGDLLAATITYLSFYAAQRPPQAWSRFLLLGGIAFLAMCCYLISLQHFVRKIEIPANGSVVIVSVGLREDAFATQTFQGESDWDMLRARGTSDEDVLRLWTERSLDVARLCLFASYCGFILPLVLIFSLGVRYQM